MTDYKSIKLSVKDLELLETEILDEEDVSYKVECSNEKDMEEEVLCSLNLAHNHRDIQSTYIARYVTDSLSLEGFLTSISVKVLQSFNLSSTIFNLDNRNQGQLIDIDANWSLNGTEILNYSLISPQLPDANAFTTTLPEETCISINFSDRIYKLRQRYAARSEISSDDSTDDLLQLANLLTNNRTIYNTEDHLSFDSIIELESHHIFTNVTQIDSVPCPSLTFPPEPTIIEPISDDFSIKRYGVYSNPMTFNNSLGEYYGFQGEQANLALYSPYNALNKFDHLVIGDQCFKVRIFIVIPIPVVFFVIIIVFPLWIDASIITTITKELTSQLNTAVDLAEDIKSKLEEIKDQINLKNAVALGARGVAISRLVVTGQANQLLLDAVKDFAEKQLNTITNAKKYFELLASIGDMKKIIDKVQELVELLSGLNAITDMFSSEQASSKALLKSLETTNNVIEFAFNEIIELLEIIPDNVVKRTAIEVLRDIREFMDMIKAQAIKKALELDISDPASVAIGVLDIILYVPALKILLGIGSKLNIMNLAYDLLLEQLDQFGLIKLASELDEAASASNKTQFEKNLIEAAYTAATAIDGVAEKYKELNPLFYADKYQKIAFEYAFAGVRYATAAIDSAIDDIGKKKKEVIGNRIGAYLRDTLDIYKISRIGRFDSTDISANQLIINDVAGTRIYSQTGVELFKKGDFCNMPFIRFTGRLNSGGCQADRDPCGVGGYNCQEINYWNTIFKYRVSFDFYDNHDLSQGGIVIGDFDGDGIDDIWCHYPKNAKNYNPETANQILYSPLRPKLTNNRVNYEVTLSIDGWCDDGIVKTGDFSGDGKSDVVCVADSKLYLLYSNGGNFYPITEDSKGLLALPSVNLADWKKDSVVVTGDFDGDGYCDIAKITSNDIDILYGHKESIFVQRYSETQSISNGYKPYLSQCATVGVNKIIVSDINNDGKDDISCVVGNYNEATVTIYSNINSYTNLAEEGGIIRLFVDDISLQPLASKNSITNHVILGEQIINNRKSPAEHLIISHDKAYNNQQTVSDLYLPLECLRVGKYSLETYFTASTEYSLPESIIWEQASPLASRSIDIDMSATYVKGVLIDITSNKLQSFEYKLESIGGVCYNATSSTNFISLTVNYNATLRMSIERDNVLLTGRILEDEAKQILSSFDTYEKYVTFPVNGHLTLNLLGVGYDQVDECTKV